MSEKSKNGPIGGGSAEQVRSTLLHWSAPALPSAIAGAAVLTAVRDVEFYFAIVACVAWALVAMLTYMATSHDWASCQLCSLPPRGVATSEARLRLAHRVHSRVAHQLHRALLLALLLAILFPKPYLHPETWRLRVIQAAVLTVVVSLLLRRFLRVALHMSYRSVCPKETCRADLHKEPGRWSAALAHYAVWNLLVLAPITTTVGVLAVHLNGWWTIAYSAAHLLMITLLIFSLHHATTPCMTCARRLPTNGGELAEKRMWWLKFWHRDSLWLFSYSLAAWVMSWALADTVLGRVLVGSAGTVLIALILLTRAHSRVQPWCPWCRDDNGNDVGSESPDPARNAPTPV